MSLVLVGVNFRTAPLALREKLSVGAEDVPGTLRRIKGRLPDTEAILLSTCNRTELYLASPEVQAHGSSLRRFLAEGGKAGLAEERYFYVRKDLYAVAHLLAVASGLDSMILGETEILGQVKRAYRMGNEAGTTGRMLHPLFQKAFKAAKRIRTETGICRGRASVSSVAVDLAERVLDDLSRRSVMIVGAGRTGERTLRSLIGKGVKDVLVLNRSLERGRKLAERCGGRALPLRLLADCLPRADIVISSTDASHRVICAEMVRRAVVVRGGRPMLLIDIAVPRDIETAAGRLRNVCLFNIDDLREAAARNLAGRRKALGRALSIVREETAKFAARFRRSPCPGRGGPAASS